MWKYVGKRLLQMIPVLLIVSFVVFWLMSMSADPASTIMGDVASAEQIAAKREAMGLNRPLLVRYGEYIWNVLHGDFGLSLYGKNVWEQFSARFPFTLLLCAGSILLTVLVSIPFGIIAALKKDTWIDSIISALAMFGVSMPVFWLGLLLMLLFGVKLGWLPTTGIQGGVLKSAILPSVTSAITALATMTRMTRSSMLDNLNADYLRTYRSKGVREHDVIWKHCLKNALLPIITTIGGQFNVLIGGAVTLEIVFTWPGIGNLIISSVRSGDYMMVCGCVIMVCLAVAIGQLVVDLAYALVDPRIRAQYSGK